MLIKAKQTLFLLLLEFIYKTTHNAANRDQKGSSQSHGLFLSRAIEVISYERLFLSASVAVFFFSG